MIFWFWLCGLQLFINHCLAEVIDKTTNCNRNLYEKPLCLDQATHYNCKCNAGFIWNGQMCVSTALNSYFEFNRKSKSHFVLLEKTFPRLESFTISTWIQIHNYLTGSSFFNSEKLLKYNQRLAKRLETTNSDIRSIFSYSLANYKNAISCQITTAVKSKNKNIKRTKVRLNLKLKILESLCILDVKHLYLNELYWFHITFTWNSSDGKVNFYINGKLKAECIDIANHQPISTAGEFVLGQTYADQQSEEQDTPDESENAATLNDSSEEDSPSKYEQKSSFLGRLFNFNIWDRAFSADIVHKLYNDEGLTYCGNATQWSDFRSGTRGDVKMKWPTNLLWKFSKAYQHRSCNHYCNKMIGPVCRESFGKNIRWPSTKGNQTSKLQCFQQQADQYATSDKAIKYAYRECSLQSNQKKAFSRGRDGQPFTDRQKISNRDYSYASLHFQTAAWLRPNVDECVQEPLLELSKEVLSFIRTDNFDDAKIFVYLDQLYELANHVLSIVPQKSIFDVAYIIDILFYLTEAQQQTIKRNLDIGFNYDFDDGKLFATRSLSIVDMIISKSNDIGLWGASNPIGSEAIRIVKVVQITARCLYDLQNLHFMDTSVQKIKKNRSHNKQLASQGNISEVPFYELIEIKFKNLNFRQQLLYSQEQMPLNFKFPYTTESPGLAATNPQDSNTYESNSNKKYYASNTNKDDTSSHDSTSASLSTTFHSQVNFNDVNLVLPINVNSKTKLLEPYSLLTVYYVGIEDLLPNHNKTFRAKDNNLNSMLITVELLNRNGLVNLDGANYNMTFDKPITIIYDYLNNFNISDTRCVHLKDSEEKMKNFEWSRNTCQLRNKNPSSAVCECLGTGSFSITNDLYDPSWTPFIIENPPLVLASYIGCVFVSLFGLATFACLTYLRTKSVTTSIHKNLCVAVCFSQLLIIAGLTKFDYGENVCQVLGLLNHYMLFVVFAWLMNEAFNLYISITYAAHQTSVNDNVSQLRTFYLLGWLFPVLLIVILYITNSEDYYDRNLCWFNLSNLWINVSPMIAMLAITILVMIISAKEHTEISYTKNEKSNKLISNHTKAVWTQIVLLTLCWTFALMSLVIYGAVIKYLFAFLNCLQGSFLFIFYFVLNEEVRKYWREKKRKNRLKTSVEKGLNLVNLVIGKDEDYDETLDETFETSEREDFETKVKKKSKKSKKTKHQKNSVDSESLKAKRHNFATKAAENSGSSKERVFIEPQGWERNVVRSHSTVDISLNTQEKITVL